MRGCGSLRRSQRGAHTNDGEHEDVDAPGGFVRGGCEDEKNLFARLLVGGTVDVRTPVVEPVCAILNRMQTDEEASRFVFVLQFSLRAHK